MRYAGAPRAYPGIGVGLRCWCRYIPIFAQTGFLYKRQQVKFFVLVCHYHVIACTYPLQAKVECIDGLCPLPCSSGCNPLLVCTIENGLCWANGCTHRAFSLRRPVIAQVAFAHIVACNVELRYAEWAGVTAVFTVDASCFVGRLYDAVGTHQNGLRGTNLCARGQRVLTVHAKRRRRSHGIMAFDIIDVDHALAFVRLTLAAGSHTRAASDAA